MYAKLDAKRPSDCYHPSLVALGGECMHSHEGVLLCWRSADCALYRQAGQLMQLHCPRNVLHKCWLHPKSIPIDWFVI